MGVQRRHQAVLMSMRGFSDVSGGLGCAACMALRPARVRRGKCSIVRCDAAWIACMAIHGGVDVDITSEPGGRAAGGTMARLRDSRLAPATHGGGRSHMRCAAHRCHLSDSDG